VKVQALGRVRVGHSNGGAAVLWEGVGGGRPLPQRGSGGVTLGKILKLQMRNPSFLCIFSPVPRDPRPWMKDCCMRSVRVRRELTRKIGACGGLEPKKLNIPMYVV